MADEDGVSSRFTSLLQPIRDLAMNWDIDIASALEEYLEDLEGITITLGAELKSAVSAGEEVDTINFAEAALLIQGSALVYSKKVEYLYQLVHHTLDIVTNHKSKSSTRQVTTNALAEDEAAFKEASSNFLLLDDHIKEGKDIDIVDMEYDASLHGYDTRGAALAKHINASNNPMLALLLKEKRGSSFRLNSCEVHPSGALMIGSAQMGGQISDTLEKLISPSSVYFSPNNNNNNNPPQMLNQKDDDSLDGHEDYFGPNAGYDDDDQMLNTDPQLSNDVAHESTLFGTSHVASSKQTQTRRTKDTSGPNPWQLLDPHDCSKQQIRPMRAGKTFKVPSLVDPRHEANEVKKSKSQSNTDSMKLKSDKVRFQGLANPEFSYILKMEKTRKMSLRRLENKSKQSWDDQDVFEDDDRETGDYDGGVDFGVYGDGGNDDLEEDADSGYLPNPNAMMSQFDEVQGISHSSGYGEGAINQLELEDAFDQAPKTYADLCRDHIAKYMQGVDRYAHESQLSMRVGEWQDRLAPMLKEQESRRPFDIHEYGREIIKKCVEVTESNKEQSLRSKQGNRALSATRDMPIDFCEMTASQPQFEVCRLFLASLQLSNNLNVKLHHGEGVCGPDDLKLEVLNTHVGEDRFM